MVGLGRLVGLLVLLVHGGVNGVLRGLLHAEVLVGRDLLGLVVLPRGQTLDQLVVFLDLLLVVLQRLQLQIYRAGI